MSSEPYSYCFLRYRQNPEAGEFANIGVVLWAQESRFLGFQGSKRFSRLTHFFGDLDRDGYRLLLAHVERRFDTLAHRVEDDVLGLMPLPASVRDFALRVVPEDDGAVLWSPVRGGFTEEPNAELSRVYAEYIGRLNEAPEPQRRDDEQVFREVFPSRLFRCHCCSPNHRARGGCATGEPCFQERVEERGMECV